MMAMEKAMTGVSFAGLLKGEAHPAGGGTPILGLCLDSREVRPGWLFLACKGHDHHGLKHLADAHARGAAAVAFDPAGAEPYLPVPG
ncbi:MAG TPA: Mur ligase domain-containing protein, partial [Gammaproteobacteria bacterium]|nr:Mur ligase domain-containing protein [Gammaproteobacteria bacterium]